MTTKAKNKLPIITIQHNSMDAKELAHLSRAIVSALKDIYPNDYHIIHRSFTGAEIVIKVEIAKIIA